MQPDEPRFLLVPEQRQQLETFAALTAMALERVHYIEVAQSATVQMESERLRNSLLAALSHDLRTPLAALVGTAEMLAGEPAGAQRAAARDGARASSEKSLRMADMVTNLLDMARIQSGEIRLRRGVAVDRRDHRQRGEVVRTARWVSARSACRSIPACRWWSATPC